MREVGRAVFQFCSDRSYGFEPPASRFRIVPAGKNRAAISRILVIDAILSEVLLSVRQGFPEPPEAGKMEKGQDCGMETAFVRRTDRDATGAALRLLRRETWRT